MVDRLKATVRKAARLAVIRDRQMWIGRGLWCALALLIAAVVKWITESLL